MGAALGLIAGIGLLLVWRAVTDDRDGSSPVNRPSLARLSNLLRASGISDVSPVGFISLCVISGALTTAVVLAMSRTPPVALTFGVLASYGPFALVKGRARRRRRELAEVWPEAVDNLASAVRAGLSLPEALTQLGERGPAPLRSAFAEFGHDYLATGRFGDCLNRLKDQLADAVGDRVIEALRIAREVGGGDLGRMLRALSRFLRDDARTRAELESRQAWVVNGARLATGAPWAVLLALSMQPEVVGRYRSAGGIIVLISGAIACIVAYRLMVWIGRLPEEQRVLS